MNSLDRIQKIIKVFKILTNIAMIFAYVCAGLLVVTAILMANNSSYELISGSAPKMFAELDRNKTIAELLCDFVVCLTDGLLLTFTQLYLKHELADGTPFTNKGANEVKSLGIRIIILPLVAIGIISAICATFNTELPDTMSNELSISFGIALIIISIIFRYGSELESKVNGNSDMKQGEQFES